MKKRLDTLEKDMQKLMLWKYNQLVKDLDKKTIFRNHEFKIYSQEGEDGLFLYIFSKIGTTNHYFVEVGCGNGKTCNTANLSINFGWHGLLIDGKRSRIVRAKHFYKNIPEINPAQIKIVQCFVTMENINKVLLSNGVKGEIDLLSIDIDGNDYWIWKAINAINPRVVVIEYNASFGYERSLTVKYDPNFDRFKKHPSGFYFGASLLAFTKLARSRGYILVGCDSSGANAFFVRKDVAHQKLHKVSVREAYFPHYEVNLPYFRKFGWLTTSEQFECIKHLDFDYV